MLLTGLHWSVATHYCGGELAAVKLSISHELAGCGMMGDHDQLPQGVITNEPCCEDVVFTLHTDNIYEPVTKEQVNVQSLQLQPLFAQDITLKTPHIYVVSHTNVRPPGKFLPSDVNLSGICVFRI